MRYVVLLIAVLAATSGCGSDDANSRDSAAVEQSLKAQLATGKGGGVVELDGDLPRRVTCEKDEERENGWRCRVTTTGKRTILCVVKTDPETAKVETRTCAPIDY